MEVVASLKKDMYLQSRKQLDLHNQKDNSPIKGFLGFSFRESYFYLIRKLPVTAGAVILAPVVRVVQVGICHAESDLFGVLNLNEDAVTLDG